jgi:hypothetical protein
MDIAQLEMNDTFGVNIVLPDGTETDMVVDVYGIDSPQYKKASLARQNKALKGMKRGKQKDATAEEIEDRGFEVLVSCTAGWSGFESGGKPLEFNDENVDNVYRKFSFIKEQVDEAISNRVNFMKR